MITFATWLLRPLANSTVLVTAATYGLLLTIAANAGLLGIWLLLLVGASLWRYAYAVLKRVAQGYTSLAPPGIESMNPIGGDWRVLVHFFAYPVVLRAIYGYFPPGLSSGPSMLGLGLVLVLVLQFPASMAIMGLTMSLVESFNPASIATVVRTLGRDYLVLVLAGLGLVALTVFVRSLIVPYLGLAAGLVGTVLSAWLLLAVFALIGSAIHAHRDDFEIPGESRARERAEQRTADDRCRGWQSELDLAYASLRSGDLEQGYATLRKLIARNEGSLELQYWLFEHMIEWEDTTHAVRVAERLIARLVEIGNVPAALELLRRCRRLATRPRISPGALRLIVRYAQEIGQTGLASELMTELDTREG